MQHRDSKTRRDPRTDKAKKAPGQTKARKGGKRHLAGEDDLLALEVKPGDPNYDADDMTSPHEVTGVWVVPTPTVEAFKPLLAVALDEYLANADSGEFVAALDEMNARDSGLQPELVKRALLRALDRKQRDRELVSQLLASLCQRQALAPAQAAQGFALLLEDDAYLGDLMLDTPDALQSLAQFVARGLADEVLPKSFLDGQFQPGPRHGAKVLDSARATYAGAQNASALSKIWGPGDGRPVAGLKREISLLLGEYYLGGDLEEATRCARELASPYYMHELVKQAVVSSIDKTPAEHEAAIALMKHLIAEQILRPAQLVQGFERTLERMDDLQLDVPRALETFTEAYVKPAQELGLPASFVDKCVPMASVKDRIVSFIDEYFDNGEAGVPEASRCLEELSVEHLHPQVVKRLAQRSMERTDRERRLASLLLYSWRQQEKLSASAVHAGFTSLGCSLADISLDVPDAQEYFGGFVRRAQHDGLIADDFFEKQ